MGVFTVANSLFSFRVEESTSDGVWDAEEVEAIYGVHHVYSQKKSKVKVMKLARCTTC